MQITIKTSEEAWTSPDGQRKIWEVTDSDGNKWQTMSRQIAQAINQTMEVTTRVNNAGKTYLIKPPVDGVGGPQAPASSLGDPRALELLERISRASESLVRIMSEHYKIDVTPEPADNPDLPPVESYDEESMAQVFNDL